MGKPRHIVGIDIGSTKFCALAAELSLGGRLEVVGANSVASQGIQRGAVVDLEAAATAASRAIRGLEVATHHKIEGVVLTTSAPVASMNSRGTAVPQRRGQGISLEDVRMALAAAADTGLPGSRQIMHAVPRRFVIDGLTETCNPIGLFGRRLDAEAHLVTIAAPSIQALIACLERSGLEVMEVVAEPLAVAQACLSREERERGVAVADIGGGSCTLSVFVDGSPWYTASIPMGGRHVTQDIATVLGVPVDAAEDLKIRAGSALPSGVDESEEVQVELAEGAAARVSRRLLCQIIEARVLEIVELVGEEIKRSGYAGLLPDGLVISGGTAQLPGTARLAGETLKMRARIGQPEMLGDMGLAGAGLSGPAYAAAMGMLLWGSQNHPRRYWSSPAHTAPKLASGSKPAATHWLRSLFTPAHRSSRT